MAGQWVGPLSVIFADIHMVRAENEVVKPMNPPFYKRIMDDIYSRKNKIQQDALFEALNDFHPNIKLTIEANPEMFLDTKIILNNNGVVTTQVYRKENKKTVPWVSKILKRYKRNTISGDLHRSRKIASNFDIEIRAMKAKYIAKLDIHDDLSKVPFGISLHLYIKMKNSLLFHEICSKSKNCFYC